MSAQGEHYATRKCVFCDRIQRGEYDAERGSDEVVSFEPLNPVTRMHRLFVPKAHVVSALDSPAVTGQVMAVAADYARQAAVPCNLLTSVGTAATQSVFHLHVHYVPRRWGDGLHLPWTGQAAASQRAEQ